MSNPDIKILTEEKLSKLSNKKLIALCLEQNKKLNALIDATETIDCDGDRAKGISDGFDPQMVQLCEHFGYGAVMDAAARMWFLKDPIGSFTVGPCAAIMRHAMAVVRGEAELPERILRNNT